MAALKALLLLAICAVVHLTAVAGNASDKIDNKVITANEKEWDMNFESGNLSSLLNSVVESAKRGFFINEEEIFDYVKFYYLPKR